MTPHRTNWGWVSVFGYLLQSSVMAPAYGQFNHWLPASLWNGLQELPALGKGQQQKINEWSIKKWGDVEDLPVEACQTEPSQTAQPITLEQYSALKIISNPSYGDVQNILGDGNSVCITTAGAHRYLPDWRAGALDITYPAGNGFTAVLEWANPGAPGDTGPGTGLATSP